LPNTITRKWAESLPRHGDVLAADNPFLWEIGAREVVKERTKSAKNFAAIASRSLAVVTSSAQAFEAAIPRVGYYLGFVAEVEAALSGSTPLHLATAITDEPSSPFLFRPDKGFDEVRHQALEAAHKMLTRHQPFSWPSDADRDFSPIFYDAVPDSPETAPIQDPALTDAAVSLARPAGIDPTMTYQPTDLVELHASLRKGEDSKGP